MLTDLCQKDHVGEAITDLVIEDEEENQSNQVGLIKPSLSDRGWRRKPSQGDRGWRRKPSLSDRGWRRKSSLTKLD